MLEIELPHPPSVNHYWRHCKGRHFISKEGREYRQYVTIAVKNSRIDMIRKPVKLAVEIEWHPPDRRRRDVDNIVKALFDALQHGGAVEDDNQFRKLYVYDAGPEKPGRVVVRITETGEAK